MRVPWSTATKRATLLERFRADQRGGVALIIGLALPCLLGGVVAAVEYTSLKSRHAKLQLAADGAALIAARELTLINTEDARIVSVAKAAALSASASGKAQGAGTTAEAEVVNSRSGVRVNLQETVPTVMGRLLSLPTADLRVTATAKVSGGQKLCFLALDPDRAGALTLNNNARLTAETCAVHSNSKHECGIVNNTTGLLKAQRICSAGGISGSSGNYNPAPLTDCPAIADPLAGRARPSVGPCSQTNWQRSGGEHVLSPGVYCGGITVLGGARVRFQSGEYILTGGGLLVGANGSIEGDNVGFYLDGGATFNFGAQTTVSLSAPKTGPLAGLLFHGDPSANNPIFQINSNNARRLLGTIYLPAGQLRVDASNPVADQSDYTIIVARQVSLFSGPNLVLNSNYGGTDVPVPKGVGPIGSTVSLSQ
ncbi:MAG TPA: pilus assembly protein TadG-related protein [Salinarimonas sp.]|nr:pilus assembly protein TadG-related protein [Salinarimonas sp.]